MAEAAIQISSRQLPNQYMRTAGGVVFLASSPTAKFDGEHIFAAASHHLSSRRRLRAALPIIVTLSLSGLAGGGPT